MVLMLFRGNRRVVIALLLSGLCVGLYTWNLISTNRILLSKHLMKHQTPVPTRGNIQRANVEKDPFPPIQQGPIRTLFREDIPIGKFNERDKFVESEDVGSGFSLGSDFTPFPVPYKLVHIDLKGAPPKLSYLKWVLSSAKEAGANGILLEYEDMFPFSGILGNASHKQHFSKDEMKELISVALDNDLEVIPLVQTFGHLEWILKLEEFRSLREIDAFPQEICPLNDEAWTLLTQMIDQVLSLKYRKESRIGSNSFPNYIHIGCDEVYHIGECSKCRDKVVLDLFLNHVSRVATYIHQKYGIQPIIWDDMLRKFNLQEIEGSRIGSLVELMVWDYTEDVDRLLSPYLWPTYASVFPNIWVASAFKGAFGESLYKVEIERHALNQLSWLRVLSRESVRIRNLRGVALTGWSRYDHFSVLCELLPVAMPSLFLALQIWVEQNYIKAKQNLFKLLSCDQNSLDRVDDCYWEGADLASALRTLDYYQSESRNLLEKERNTRGWLTFYNVQHNYSSPFRLAQGIQEASTLINSLQDYGKRMKTLLAKYFPSFVQREWIEEKVQSLVSALSTLIEEGRSLEKRRVWPRRPID